MRGEVSLHGARVLLTGALGGIGSAVASRLRAEGAQIVGIDLASAPGVIAADIRERDAVQAAVTEAAGRMGGIDVLINNAGIGGAHDVGAWPDEDAHSTLEVNFFGAWNCTAASLGYLLESKGHVINVSSGLAFVNLPYAVAYSASKRALAAYSAALQLEYRGRLHVTTVYPGYIKTSIHERAARSGVSLDGIVRPDDLDVAARAIVRACKRRPYSASTSFRSGLELWAARRFPRATARVMQTRVDRWSRRRAAPPFLRYPDNQVWRSP